MNQYPIKSQIVASAGAGTQQPWSSAAEHCPNQAIRVAIPPEFNGPGQALSPKDLYGLAIINCFIATFKAIAEASDFQFEKIDTILDLEVDKNDQGILWLACAHLSAKLFGPSRPEKAERLMAKAGQNCLVMNSIKTHKSFEFQVA